MASTREERLQMRQRGAGTRKIQQVDFGISFGGQGIGPSESASIPLFPEPAEASQLPSAPTAATPPAKVASHADAQGELRSQRTPGSARNQLPQRPSTFDIPPDNGPGEPPSNKKRKLNPSSEKVESPFRRSPRGSPNRNSTATPNGGTAAEAAQRESSSNASGPPILLHAEPSADDRTEEATETETNGTGVLTVANEAQNTTPESRTHTPFASGSRDTALENIRQSTDISQETQLAEQRELAESSPKKAAKVAQDRSAKRASPNSLSPRPPRGKISKTAATRKRGASNDAPDSGQGSTSASTHSSEVEADLVESAEQNERAQRPSRTTRKSTRGGGEITNVGSEAAKAKGPRGRASLGKPAGAIEIRQASPGEPTNEATEETSGPKTRKERQATKKADARPDPEVEARERHDSPSETAQASSKTAKQSKRSARKAKKAQSQTEREPEPEIEDEAELEHPEEPEPEPQPGPSKPRRGRSTKKAKRATETQATARIEQPGAPPEPEIEAEPESAAPSGPSKSRRTVGRRAHEATEPQTADTEEQPEQADAAPRRSTRKTREPRGETVPVTVHRLANISVFEASHVDPGEDGRDSGDEPSAHQKTKLPSRGGVNPADVLSQICRETLEKTLATLKNGIDNETNQNKRAEWTRKRKAVEAFSAELDGRLLDLSEMLDSNFVLGVQLKKSKRDMMDLRGHLYKVRKERESVALQMDAVRAKHMEEENAKTARMTINNSLHSLELALDRSQHRAPSGAEPLSADLDFMLRTVADDVSSRAPGAHGGLLNQIRAFNVQLESTARRLER